VANLVGVGTVRHAVPVDDRLAASTATGAARHLGRDVYEARDLSDYTRAQRLTIRVASLFFYWLIAMLYRTLRWRVEGWHHHDAVEASGEGYIAPPEALEAMATEPDGPQHAGPHGPATKEDLSWRLDGSDRARTATHRSPTSKA